MDMSEQTRMFLKVFLPGVSEIYEMVSSQKSRFVYYTDAETATKIIVNKELWLRNAAVMNDFSEISYGLNIIRRAFEGKSGKKFIESANDVFPDAMKKVQDVFNKWEHDWQFETYIMCVSMHDRSEDYNGRLSMWRAYGNTALVVNNTPLLSQTDQLGVYSTPVFYITLDEFETRLSNIAEMVFENKKYLRDLGEEIFIQQIYEMLFLVAIGTKHPGFSEEREWRIYYRPYERPNDFLKKDRVVLRGVLQEVWKVPLVHDPDHGLFHADIPSLLDRIIVGPIEDSYVSTRAFIRLLEDHDVENAINKVIPSDIPLRSSF